MNFFDTYDIARTPTPQPTDANQPSLNEEVNQVIGQLGRFWGGFREQSQKALETARGGFGEVVVQAQKELGKFTGNPEPAELGPQEGTSTSERSTGPPSPADSFEDAESSHTVSEPTPRVESPSSSNVFSRLQLALPPNLVSAVQSHIPESVKHASESIDLVQIKSNLLTEFQRVQGITRAQAEEYAHKSEALLREAVKEASEVLKDAVKIIPPAPEAGADTGLIWDGSDMWMLPTEPSQASTSGKEKATESRAGESQNAVASRALALLQRLQSDPSIIQHDPEVDEATKDSYKKWLQSEVDSKEGGINGTEWASKIDALLKDETSLYEMYTSLVPTTMTKERFWSRYFFRAHQIKHEEERRKALIQATAESDDEFSWEDDEEDASSSEPPKALPPTEQTLSPETTQVLTATALNPRVGSVDSFDVVSSTNTSVAGDAKQPAESGTDDGDSDWE